MRSTTRSTQTIGAALLLLAVQQADSQAPPIDSVALYREYKAGPLRADAKYEGHRIDVSGRVIKVDFVDMGLGHMRTVLLAGGPKGTVDGVMACFTESCSSIRRPTIDDASFKSSIAVGRVVVMNCLAIPVQWWPADTRENIDLSLTKCTLEPPK